MKNKRIVGYYLHSIGYGTTPDSLSSYGVQKKINAQCKAFNQFFTLSEITQEQKNNSFKNRIISRLPFTAISEKWKYDSRYDTADFIYFRKNIIDHSIISFFRKIKKRNPSCKIILEIPTYPYDKEEFKTIKDLPFKLKDRINRRKLYKYVDLSTTFTSSTKEMFGMPAITLMNGIDFDSIPLKTEFDTKNIRIIVMSLFSHWHGFERLIKGLANYRKTNCHRDIEIHFVGEGVAIPSYKALVESNSLQDFVFFHGPQSGEELNKLFNHCNLACDSLGLHRLNLEFSSTLKSREYCARGLPLLCSSKIDFIDESFGYCLFLPSNDDPIDFFRIIDFFDRIYEDNPRIVSTRIREYAKEKVDMVSTIRPVVNYIMEVKK